MSIDTIGTGVVHEDELPEQVLGCCVQHAVHGPQQGGPRLIVEADDDWRWR